MTPICANSKEKITYRGPPKAKERERGKAMGYWMEIKMTYTNTVVTNCQYCGKMIPRRVYRETILGSELSFCGQECAQDYAVLVSNDSPSQSGP